MTTVESQDDRSKARPKVYEGGAFFNISVDGRLGRAWLPHKIIDDVARKEIDRAKREVFSRPRARITLWSGLLAIIVSLSLLWRSIITAAIGIYGIATLLALSCVVWFSAREVRSYKNESLRRAQGRVSDAIIAHIKKIVTSGLFLYSTEWAYLRDLIFERDGYSCKSDSRHRELQVDHIMPRSKFPERSLDPENLQILCRKCNFRKGARFVPEGQGGFSFGTDSSPRKNRPS